MSLEGVYNIHKHYIVIIYETNSTLNHKTMLPID